MPNLLSSNDKKISKEFLDKGYIIRNVEDLSKLDILRNILIKKITKKNIHNTEIDDFLNSYHDNIKIRELNKIRLKTINSINNDKEFKKYYFDIFRSYLEILVGNELSMQIRMGLSIQLPKDKNSLLPIHSDVWSGDSPFEVVTWLPFVNVYNSKSMYLLPPKYYNDVNKYFRFKSVRNSETLFNKIKKKVKWLNLKYGQILIFNQTLPHGNIVNSEKETRWSINCRFKGAFTPYGDKKLGEFFAPITLRIASQIGMKYKIPKIND